MGLSFTANSPELQGATAQWIQLVHTNIDPHSITPMPHGWYTASDGSYYFIDSGSTSNPFYTSTLPNSTNFLDRPGGTGSSSGYMNLTVWIGSWEGNEPVSNVLNIALMGVSYGYYDPRDHDPRDHDPRDH
jgi:hypothetical protein